MIHNVSFRRKIMYLCVIALLLLPLYMLGRPATGDPSQDVDARPGGTLARLRTDYELSQAQLGEIDPASESMRLATLGLRGVAANILWTKANNYKKKHNWEALVATVIQMAKLQPNFVTIWEFQSHNLSYNVSVEQDDYRFRYLWVKRGIDFLIQGTRYNRREPRLHHTVGWYMGQKFGRADEHKQFRRLFRDDDDFHRSLSRYVDVDREGRGVDSRPDNWLVSRLWFLRAYSLVDEQGASLRGKSHHIFFADGPKAWMNYASTIESEGYLDEQAEIAWRRAGQEWREFGDRLVPTSWGVNIRLNDEERLRSEAERLQQQLDALTPGAREAIYEEKRDALPPEDRKALDTPFEEIQDQATGERHFRAKQETIVTHREVAERAPSDQRARANRLATQILEMELNAQRINHYRTNVNFNYWRTRAEVEQKPETVAARRHVYDAKRLQDQGELENAIREYDKAWQLWSQIVAVNPDLLQQLMADDLQEDVQRDAQLLGQLERRLPADFPLMGVIEMYGELPDYLEPERKRRPSTDAADEDMDKPVTEAKAVTDEKEQPAVEEKPAMEAKAEPTVEEKPAVAEKEKPAAVEKPAAEEKPAEEAKVKPAAEKKPAAKAKEKPAAEAEPTEDAKAKPAVDEPEKPAADESEPTVGEKPAEVEPDAEPDSTDDGQ